jgi:hypothetical protein
LNVVSDSFTGFSLTGEASPPMRYETLSPLLSKVLAEVSSSLCRSVFVKIPLSKIFHPTSPFDKKIAVRIY